MKLDYHIYIFENMDEVASRPHPNDGVVATRTLLDKIFRNHHCIQC